MQKVLDFWVFDFLEFRIVFGCFDFGVLDGCILDP